MTAGRIIGLPTLGAWVVLVCTSCVETEPMVVSPCEEPGGIELVAPVPDLETPSSVLSDGFGVPRVALLNLGGGTHRLEASANDYVTCAAFRSPPHIEEIDVDRRDDALFEPRRVIADFDACVVAYRSFQMDEPMFGLDELDIVPEAVACEDPSLDPATIDAARRTALWLGCWVYDSTGIIEASELVPISGPTGGPALTPDCTDGLGCLRDDGDGVGVCSAGSCVPWCSHAACPGD